MIIKYKIFEKLNQGEPEVGDYIIIKNKIGQITNDFPPNSNNKPATYETKFDNQIWWISFDEIRYWSKDKKDLERVLKTKNYSL